MKILSWFIVFLGVCGLIGVRVLEDRIFYDPFLDYFHAGVKNIAFPEFDWAKLILSHVFRFSLNLIFSCIVVHFIFKRKEWTLQAAVLITLAFCITLPIYLYCIYNEFEIGYLFSFYIRRFVIQPILLLLIIPLFYYRKNVELKSQ